MDALIQLVDRTKTATALVPLNVRRTAHMDFHRLVVDAEIWCENAKSADETATLLKSSRYGDLVEPLPVVELLFRHIRSREEANGSVRLTIMLEQDSAAHIVFDEPGLPEFAFDDLDLTTTSRDSSFVAYLGIKLTHPDACTMGEAFKKAMGPMEAGKPFRFMQYGNEEFSVSARSVEYIWTECEVSEGHMRFTLTGSFS